MAKNHDSTTIPANAMTRRAAMTGAAAAIPVAIARAAAAEPAEPADPIFALIESVKAAIHNTTIAMNLHRAAESALEKNNPDACFHRNYITFGAPAVSLTGNDGKEHELRVYSNKDIGKLSNLLVRDSDRRFTPSDARVWRKIMRKRLATKIEENRAARVDLDRAHSMMAQALWAEGSAIDILMETTPTTPTGFAAWAKFIGDLAAAEHDEYLSPQQMRAFIATVGTFAQSVA